MKTLLGCLRTSTHARGDGVLVGSPSKFLRMLGGKTPIATTLGSKMTARLPQGFRELGHGKSTAMLGHVFPIITLNFKKCLAPQNHPNVTLRFETNS